MPRCQTLQDVPEKVDGTTIKNSKGILGLKNDFITINDVKVKLGESISLESSVNVKDFGATGDGVTDDSTAIQAALNSGEKTIIFPKGIYNLGTNNNGPTIPSDRKLIGYKAIIIQPNYDASSTISTGTEYVALRANSGSSNIFIDGLELRGPFYGTTVTPSYRSIGIHIQGRYDQYFYDNANYPNNPSVTPTDVSSNINITNCKIDGFGQSGVLADNINNFSCSNNTITNIVRDGVRTYGCKDFDISHNIIDNMSDGFPGEGISPNTNVYGISATRIYHSTAADGSTTDYRPSQRGIISNNRVSNCANWKALDTHGGTDITFDSNIIYNAHIGIGIDKGGATLGDGYGPPRRLIVTNNIILAGLDNTEKKRAAITLFANDDTDNNIGLDFVISGNIFEGFGTDSAGNDGGLTISNCKFVNVSNNIFKNQTKRGIRLRNTVEECVIANNIFRDITQVSSYAAGINISNAKCRANVCGNTFHQESSLGTMQALSTTTPDSGYGAKLSDDNAFYGDVTSIDNINRLADSSFFSRSDFHTVSSDGKLGGSLPASVKSNINSASNVESLKTAILGLFQ